MITLFISDLHLCKERPEVIDLFIRFLETDARAAKALYILGDLFEYWIGDEAVAYPEYQPVIQAMHELADQGTQLYVMHGNRDFLMGEEFARASGCHLIQDPTIIDLYGNTTLLMHGDTLGTDDVPYLEFRKMVRSPEWQTQFLAKSVAEREQISQSYREQSKAAMADKKPEIMDANQGAVEQQMRQHKVHHLIHGHTHRPDMHNFMLDGEPAERIVLGDWYEQGSVLRCRARKWSLDALPVK